MQNKKYKYAVYIGRFQPFHNGHYYILDEASKIAEKIILLIGSANLAKNIKNPFSYREREQMIPDSINDVKIIKRRLDDCINDNDWILNVQKTISMLTNNTDDRLICLVGCNKDSSTYYLKNFFIWNIINFPKKFDVDASYIREIIFKRNNFINLISIPNKTKEFLLRWINSKDYQNLKEEYEFIEKYKAQFSNLPYPPTFFTTDAVVFCKGHILLLKRKFLPGKGLWALPGGFINVKKDILTNCIDVLKKETGIKIDKKKIRNSLIDSEIFDNPERSVRGRTITNAFLFILKDIDLPEIKNTKSGDVRWVSFKDFFVYDYETKMFEDHYFIITHFYLKKGFQI